MTDEPMNHQRWVEGSPDGDAAQDTVMRLVEGTNGGMDDADPDDLWAAAAFVIEWGESRSADPNQEDPGLQPVDNEWKTWRPKAARLVREKKTWHAKELVDNGNSLRDSLDRWHKMLSPGDKRTFYRGAAYVKGLVDAKGRIREAKMKVGLPLRGFNIWEEHQDKQDKLDAELQEYLENLRTSYLKNLRKVQAPLDEAGLVPQSREIQKEIDACGEDVPSFLEYLEVDP